MMIIINNRALAVRSHGDRPMPATSKGAALITGASSGIGAVYADRLARQGYDVILVARDAAAMDDLAKDIRTRNGVKVEVLKADLVNPFELGQVEKRLREDKAITLLVNNAGMTAGDGFAATDIEKHQSVLDLNITALVRLTHAVTPGFLARGGGAIINVASVLAYYPEFSLGVYAATKAFVASFTQTLQTELGDKEIYVQAVLPAGTRTAIWAKAGRSVDDFKPGTLMDVETMVDAALVGFARREKATFPSLPDGGLYDAFDAARLAMAAEFSHDQPGARYRQPELV
jgi:short-subunit dehydrogenase